MRGLSLCSPPPAASTRSGPIVSPSGMRWASRSSSLGLFIRLSPATAVRAKTWQRSDAQPFTIAPLSCSLRLVAAPGLGTSGGGAMLLVLAMILGLLGGVRLSHDGGCRRDPRIGNDSES